MSLPEFAPYESMSMGVLAFRENACVFANAAARLLFGMTDGELLGMKPGALAETILSKDDLQWVLPLTRAFEETGTGAADRELWVQLAPKGRKPVTAHVSRIPTPRPDETLIVLNHAADASEHRLAEAMVHAAREFVRCREERAVFEIAADAIHAAGHWVAVLKLEGDDLLHYVIRQDPELVKRAEALWGQDSHELRFHRSKLPHLDRLLQTGRAAFSENILAIVDKFHEAPVSSMMRETMPAARNVDAPIIVDGTSWGMLSVQSATLTPTSTVTIELFAQLLAAAVENVRHHQHAAKQLRELSSLQQELVSHARLAAVGEAAGMLSHEARNPLGAILNALAVLRKRNVAGSDGTLLLDIAEEEALKLDALVKDLMELARPLEPRVRPMRVEDVLEAASSDVARRLGRNAPQFSVSIEPGVPVVNADPPLLRVAVENLLRNAAQGGGVSNVRVELRAEAGQVVLSVTEPTHGRSEAESKPFDPFAAARARGTGLGLLVVKRSVEAQGGTVRAAADGARLEIVLPVAGRQA